MKAILFKLSSRLGLTALSRSVLVRGGRFALCFHGVSKRLHPDLPANVQPYLSIEGLKDTLSWLKQRFSLLTPQEFFEGSARGVLLTFDDGLANQCANVLPVLEEFQAPAVFFISTQHMQNQRDWLPATRAMARKRWEREGDVPREIAEDFYDGMTPAQVRCCVSSGLVTVGAHTVTHPNLTQCTNQQLEEELRLPREALEGIINAPVDLFAYPAGNYDNRVIDAVRAAGYRAAFALDTKRVSELRFEIPRIGIYSSAESYVAAKVSGIHRDAIRQRIELN